MRITMSRLIRYKAFQKLTISYFLLILITVCLLSSLLFYLFSASAVKEIDSNSKGMLSQISYASDVVYNQVMTIGNSLINDPQIITFLNGKEEDKTENYHTFLKLSQIKSAYPFIHSIGIYRPSSDTSVDTSGMPFDKSLYAISSKYMEFHPRKLSITGFNNNNPIQLLTFLLYPDYSMNSSTNPLIWIDVDEQSILTTIRKIGYTDAMNNVFVMNSEGQVLSHTKSNLFLKDLSQEDYVKRILRKGDAELSFTTTVLQEKNLVTYVVSEEMGWYFVSITPYNNLISNISELRNVVLAVTIALVLIGLLISIFLTKNMYKPMSSLIDTIKQKSMSPSKSQVIDEYKLLTEVFTTLEEKERSMQFELYQSSQTIQDHYLLALLKGNSSDIRIPEEVISKIDEKISGPYYCTIIFSIDKIEEVKAKVSIDQQPLLRFALGNIAKEILVEFGTCDLLITDENEAVAISQFTTGELPAQLKEALCSVQSFMNRYFKLPISIGIGELVNGRENIQYSYTSAQQYLKYRLIYGKESILDFSITRSHIMTTLNYPNFYENKLVDAVQSRNQFKIHEEIKGFTTLIATGSCNQVITYSIQLLLSLLKHFDHLQSLPDINFNEYLDAITDIEAAENLEEIEYILNKYCSKICDLIEEKNNWINLQKHNKVIEKVQGYIRDHYTEPNLSLESASEFSELSSSYLGKLFKVITGNSFSEYLNHTRLEKARVLLITTNETAAKISESVGMYNATYFSTLFKRKYGISPSAYREQASIIRVENHPSTDPRMK
ncbi:HTH-type transcriptional regulator YesS [compost metagenome]